MSEVFVSYASPDRETAFRISTFLESQGIGCWIAPRDVPPGKDYGSAILEGIENCRVLVLVLSEESNGSTFVQKEVERAVSKTKPVLPVRIREVAPSGALEFFVSSAQWVDAWRSPMEQHLSVLADAIIAMRGGNVARPAPKPVAPPPPKNRMPLIAAAVAVLVVAGGAAAWAWKPWLPAWQRSAPNFAEGSWCQQLTGIAISRTDIKPIGGDNISIEIHYSHSTEVQRAKARLELTADGFSMNWTEPEAIVGGPAEIARVKDDDHLILLSPTGEETGNLTRCPPDSGKQ